MPKKVEGTTDYHVVSITVDHVDITLESTNESLQKVRNHTVETFERVTDRGIEIIDESDLRDNQTVDFSHR